MHSTSPTPAMTLDSSAAPVLAFDIGGTKLAAGVVRGDGSIVSSSQTRTVAETADGLYELLAGLGRTVLDEAAAAGAPPVQAVGVGTGGPARDMHRLISPLSIAVWRDFPLRDRLAHDFGLPTHVDNDAKALALAEGWVGAARGVQNYIAMVVSTGVGGGIVLEGRLLDGADGNAGHVGHMFVEPDGHADATGARGNLEGQASGTAIAAITGRPAAEADRARRQRTGEYVGRAVASVANLLDLRLCVVAGSVALGYGDDFFGAAQRTIDELAKIAHAFGTKIIPAGLGANGPLVGGGAVGFRGQGYAVLH